MKHLSIAAHLDVADAQYLLGSLLHQDEGDDSEGASDDSDDAAQLVADAETNRQRAADPDEPQDLRTIRKRARAAYKQYLLSQRNDASTPAGTRLARSIVQRATRAELDRAFGVHADAAAGPRDGAAAAVVGRGRRDGGKRGRRRDAGRRVAFDARPHTATGDAHVYLGNLCLEQERRWRRTRSSGTSA
ncbi:hypothetical protein PINS_up017763 [Pythium insidiosum]|nr:hypothetical protein PINS_up017763 [Pythium insidiosum]